MGTVEVAWQMVDLDRWEPTGHVGCWACRRWVRQDAVCTLLILNEERWLVHRDCKAAAAGRLVEMEDEDEETDVELDEMDVGIGPQGEESDNEIIEDQAALMRSEFLGQAGTEGAD